RNLEGSGDNLILYLGRGAATQALHIESKRHETARPWAWYEQASSEAPAGAVPVVAFRRSRSPWLALIALDDLARLLASPPSLRSGRADGTRADGRPKHCAGRPSTLSRDGPSGWSRRRIRRSLGCESHCE